jgi:hypothetical protein
MGVSDSTTGGAASGGGTPQGVPPQGDGQSSGGDPVAKNTQSGQQAEVVQAAIGEAPGQSKTKSKEEKQQDIQQQREVDSASSSSKGKGKGKGNTTQNLPKNLGNTLDTALTKLEARSPTLVANNAAREGEGPNNNNVEEVVTAQGQQLPPGIAADSPNLLYASDENSQPSDVDKSNLMVIRAESGDTVSYMIAYKKTGDDGGDGGGDGGSGKTSGSGGSNPWGAANQATTALMEMGFESYSAMRAQDVVATELGKDFGFVAFSMTKDAESKQIESAQKNFKATQTEAIGSMVGAGLSFTASATGFGMNVSKQKTVGGVKGDGLSQMSVQMFQVTGQSMDKFSTAGAQLKAAGTKQDAQVLDIQAKTTQTIMQSIEKVADSLKSEVSKDSQLKGQLWDSVLQAINAQRAPPR